MKKIIHNVLSVSIMILVVLILGSFGLETNEWVAPEEANKLQNPFKNGSEATAKGMVIFNRMCNICHGDLGKGDGVAGISLVPPPKDLTSPFVQRQSDGAIYWKITEGRPPMASYRFVLSDEKRWQLVNYIRKLETKQIN